MSKYIMYILFSLCLFDCSSPHYQKETIEKEQHIQRKEPIMKGLSLVAPPRPFIKDPMIEIQAVNADWIAIIPYGFFRENGTDIFFNVSQQWWGEREEGIIKSIQLAKKSNIKVMLKPQLWSHHTWTGDIDFKKGEDWKKWENAYEKFILFYTNLADSLKVDMLCVGTEIKQSEIKRATFWRELIQKIKNKYQGKLTYAANWDSYLHVPFWDDLDYIGVDAYFPLDETKTPNIQTLKNKWKKVHQELLGVYEKFNKPILFTEFGYLSVDGCAGKTWELEAKTHQLPTNEKAQANALAALFDFFSQQKYWQGGFLWKWYPYEGNYQERGKNDYTPQKKEAEKILREWYGKM